MRRAAAESAVFVAGPLAVDVSDLLPPFEAVLRRERDVTVLKAACRAARAAQRRRGDCRRLADPLVDLLDHRNSIVRQHALSALAAFARTGDLPARWLPQLPTWLADSNRATRLEVSHVVEELAAAGHDLTDLLPNIATNLGRYNKWIDDGYINALVTFSASNDDRRTLVLETVQHLAAPAARAIRKELAKP